MPDYRLYFLDSDGHIKRAVELHCASDAEAIAAVEQHRDGRAMELWDRARVVRKFAATRADA
jgi:hypothetical protein